MFLIIAAAAQESDESAPVPARIRPLLGDGGDVTVVMYRLGARTTAKSRGVIHGRAIEHAAELDGETRARTIPTLQHFAHRLREHDGHRAASPRGEREVDLLLDSAASISSMRSRAMRSDF